MPPPIPSMPYAPKSLYTPRYADNIAQLLTRQGDIAAAGAARSGEIWGNFARDIGGIASGALMNYGERKAQELEQQKQQKAAEQRALMFDTALSTPWKDPMELYRRLAPVFGPEDAVKVTSGITSLQQNAEPDVKTLAAKAGALRALNDKIPGYIEKNWANIMPMVAPEAKALLGVDLGEKFTPEYADTLVALDDQLNPTKTAESKVVGGALVTPEGKVIYQAPTKAEPTLAEIEAESAARARGTASVRPPGGEGTWEEAVGANGEPVLFNAKTGETRAYPEGVKPKPTAKERAVTGAERQVLAYYNRARQALEDITPIEEKVAKYNYIQQQQLENAPNVGQTTEQKQYRQAQRAFTEARLRKESGAAIPTEEYKNDARTYFAQPGDDAATLEQKRRARAVVLQGLQYSSGRAYEEFYGEPAPKPADAKNESKAEGWTELPGGIRIRKKRP